MLVVINSYQMKRLCAFTMLSSRLVPGKLARPRWVVRSTRTRPWAPPLLRQPGARAAVKLRLLQAVSGGVSLSFWAIKHRQAAQCLTESGPTEDGGNHAAHIEGKNARAKLSQPSVLWDYLCRWPAAPRRQPLYR